MYSSWLCGSLRYQIFYSGDLIRLIFKYGSQVWLLLRSFGWGSVIVVHLKLQPR